MVIKLYVAKRKGSPKKIGWALGRAIPFLVSIAVHLKQIKINKQIISFGGGIQGGG